MVTRLVLIRHAATDPGGRLCGSFDVPLSSVGRGQLDALLTRPRRSAVPDALVTSTLSRALDVAAVLERAWNLRRSEADWAREIHCGEVEGVPLGQLQRELPELWARNEGQADDAFAWPGGETYAQFRRRVIEGLTATVATYVGGRVAVVTHAGVISQVLGVIRRRPSSVWSVERPAPLTATEVIWNNGGPSAVVSFNDPDWY